MGSVLSFHMQRILEWVPRLVNATPVQMVKMVDPPNHRTFREGIDVIGRAYIPETIERDLILQGMRGAERYAEIHKGFWALRPYVHVWEGPNEPDVSTLDAVKYWVEFTYRWMRIMHHLGYRVAVGSFSVGCPQGEPDEVRAKWEIIGPILEEAEYLALHEYSASTMQHGQGSLCLRYRTVAKYLVEMGFHVPPILITECGIDGGVMKPAHPRTGWLTWCSDRQKYLEQLIWYSEEIAKDNAEPGPPQVRAATIYNCGYYEPWGNFELDQEMFQMIAQYIIANPPDTQGGSFETRLGDLMQQHVIAQVPGHALFDYGVSRGWYPISEEAYEILPGIVSQVFYTPHDDMQHHVWTKLGHWAPEEIRSFDRPN